MEINPEAKSPPSVHVVSSPAQTKAGEFSIQPEKPFLKHSFQWKLPEFELLGNLASTAQGIFMVIYIFYATQLGQSILQFYTLTANAGCALGSPNTPCFGDNAVTQCFFS